MSKADIKQHDYCVFKHLGQGTFFCIANNVSPNYNLNMNSPFEKYYAWDIKKQKLSCDSCWNTSAFSLRKHDRWEKYKLNWPFVHACVLNLSSTQQNNKIQQMFLIRVSQMIFHSINTSDRATCLSHSAKCWALWFIRSHSTRGNTGNKLCC